MDSQREDSRHTLVTIDTPCQQRVTSVGMRVQSFLTSLMHSVNVFDTVLKLKKKVSIALNLSHQFQAGVPIRAHSKPVAVNQFSRATKTKTR